MFGPSLESDMFDLKQQKLTMVSFLCNNLFPKVNLAYCFILFLCYLTATKQVKGQNSQVFFVVVVLTRYHCKSHYKTKQKCMQPKREKTH